MTEPLTPLTSLIDLTGKVAVVTGGGRGIGATTVERLAEAGATVLAADLDLDAAQHVADTLEDRPGGSVAAHHVDVRDTASLIRLADAAVDGHGSLDIWVNNAGIYPTTGPAIDATDEFIDRMLKVNVRGSFAGAREAARRMNGSGVIVNLASTAGFRAAPGISAYVTSKHAVVGLTKALALELGPVGIRVLGVAPTVIDTPGVRDQATELAAAGVDIAKASAANPLQRGGVADDVARVILFCATDLSSLMTGSVLLVDAGTVG